MTELQLDEKNLYGIYNTWHIPFWQTTWFFVLACSCAVVIALLAVVLIIRWWKRRLVKELPWQKALRLCKALHAQPCQTREDTKKIYCSLTDILKDYFAERYEYDTRGKTDTELLVYLKEKYFPQDVLEDVSAVVNGGFLIKFANQDALKEQSRAHITLCESIIQRTIPAAKSKA
jgi:hypothetical protein